MVIGGLEFQVDIRSAQNIISPKYLLAAHQSLAKIGVPKKQSIIAIFGNLEVIKYFREIYVYKYPRDGVIMNSGENDYSDHYRNLKLFYKAYVGEERLYPFISYPDMKSNYPIQVIDLRHQVDHISSKRFNFLKIIETILQMLEYML